MRNALGKGLDALIPGSAQSNGGGTAASPTTLPIDSIKPNRLQPRKVFDERPLAELAESIRRHGLAQPVVVTRDPAGGFELVAGERRLRASKLAGLREIPAVVRETLTHQDRLLLALVENVQREDLNPIETAQAYRRLLAEFQLSQNQLAELVGKSRPAVANTLRLLELPEEIQSAILSGRLTEGHGRALLMVADLAHRRVLAQRAVELGLSVRELEDLARGSAKRARRQAPPRPVEIKELERDLQQKLGTKVHLRSSAKGVGTISIEFYSLEDLDRLVQVLKK